MVCFSGLSVCGRQYPLRKLEIRIKLWRNTSVKCEMRESCIFVKGNLQFWNKLTLNCWKYNLISNFVGKHGNHENFCVGQNRFWSDYRLFFILHFPRADMMDFMTYNTVAQLFHAKELYRPGNDPQIEPQMIPRLDRKWFPIASP